MSSRTSGCRGWFLAVAAAAMVSLIGCAGREAREQALSPAQQQLLNLQKSVELLRDSLRATAREREDFKNQFLALRAEQTTRTTDVEYLELRHRWFQAELSRVGAELAERERRLTLLGQERQHESATLAAQQAIIERLQARADDLEEERVLLERQLTGERTLREEAEQRVVESGRELERQRHELAQARSTVDGSTQATLDERRRLAEEIARLKADLVAAQNQARFRAEHRAAGAQETVAAAHAPRARTDASAAPDADRTATGTPDVAGTTAAASTTGRMASGPVDSGAVDPLAAARAWTLASIADLGAGRWPGATIAFVCVAGTLVLLLLALPLFALRSRSHRRRCRELEKQLAQVRSHPRGQSVGAGTRTRGVVSASPLDATIQIPRTVPAQPAGAATGNPVDPTAALDTPSLRKSDGGTRNRPHGAGGAQPASPTDEALLTDLKKVIREKFSEL